MSSIGDERDAREAFRREAERILAEARVVWAAFAAERRLAARVAPNGLPTFEGVVEGTTLALSAVGNVDSGFHTRAVAEARGPMRGKVRVAPPGDWDELVAQVHERDFFAEPELDRLLVVKASSESFARRVLDERALLTVRALAPARLELTVEDGAISLLWCGVERAHAVLDDVIDLLVQLAARGSETAPYR